MATIGGSNVVKSGLVLSLDAANARSYVSGSTIWRDLSGNNNSGSLVNGPTFSSANGGSLTFASGRNVTTALSNISLSSATFISWIYPTQTQSQYTGIIYNRSPFGGSTAAPAGMALYLNNSVGYTWNDTVATYNWNSGLIVPNNAWSMIALSVNSTTAVAYLCQSTGITNATNTTSHGALSGLNFFIACDPGYTTTRVFIGNIATSQIYNRALSAAEIAQNYDATKARFNL
jgi:hypothetical protein